MNCQAQVQEYYSKHSLQEATQWQQARDPISSDERIFPENCNLRMLITQTNKYIPRNLQLMQQTAPSVTIYRGDQQSLAYSRILDKQKIICKYQIELDGNQIQSREKNLLKIQYADRRAFGDQGLLYQILEVVEKQSSSLINNSVHSMGSLISAVSMFNQINVKNSSSTNRPRKIAFVNLSGQDSYQNIIEWKKSYESLGEDSSRPLYISFFQDNVDSLVYFDNEPRSQKQIINERQALLLKAEKNTEFSLHAKQITQFNKRVIKLQRDQLEQLSQSHAKSIDEQNQLLTLNNDVISLIPVAMFSAELEDYQLEFILQTLKLALSDYNPHQIFLQLGINANKSGLQRIIHELTQISNNKLMIHTELLDDNHESNHYALQKNYETLNLIIEGISNNLSPPNPLLPPNIIQDRITWFDYTYQRLLEYKNKDSKIIKFWVKDARNSCHNFQAIQSKKVYTKMGEITETHSLQQGLEFLTNKISIEDDSYELLLTDETRIFIQPHTQVLIDSKHQLIYIHDGLNHEKVVHCYGSYNQRDSNIIMKKLDQTDIQDIKFPSIVLKDNQIYWIYGYRNNEFLDQIRVFTFNGQYSVLLRDKEAKFTDVKLRTITQEDIAGRCRPGVCEQGFCDGNFALFGGEDILRDRIFNIIETIKIEGDKFYSAIINKQYCRKTSSPRVDVLPLVLFIEDSYFVFPGNKQLFQNPYSFKSDVYDQGKQITITKDSVQIQNFDLVYKGEKYIEMHKVMNGWRYIIKNDEGYQANIQKTLLYSDTLKFKLNENELDLSNERYDKSQLMNLKFQFDISNPLIQQNNENQRQKKFEITSKVLQVTYGLSLVLEQLKQQQTSQQLDDSSQIKKEFDKSCICQPDQCASGFGENNREYQRKQ